MNYKVISPKGHAIIDYALTGSLLVLPRLLGMGKAVQKTYAIEAATLLPYVALTKTPAAVKGLIPLQAHKQIDLGNVGLFALQSLAPAFRKNRKALAFNIAFTLLAGATVLLTNWKDGE